MSPSSARLAPAFALARILLLATLPILAMAAAAQPAAAVVSVGALLGVNRSGISGDAPPDAEYTKDFGFIAGVQGEVGLARDVFLSLQPMFVRRGSGVLYTDSDLSPDPIPLDLTLDYVALPVVAKFLTGGGHTYVTGGFDVAFLTGATASAFDTEVDVKDAFHDIDVGALLGFGVNFPIGRPRLTGELRYVLGMSNLSNEDTGGVVENLPSRYHSTGLQFTAGILFPLGRP